MISILIVGLFCVWSTSASIIPYSGILLPQSPLPFFYQTGITYNFKNSAIKEPAAWFEGVKPAKIETLDEEVEPATPVEAESTPAPPSSEDDNGSYKYDNSGDYVPDNSGDYVPDNSGSYQPQPEEANNEGAIGPNVAEVETISPILPPPGFYSFGFLPPGRYFRGANVVWHPLF